MAFDRPIGIMTIYSEASSASLEEQTCVAHVLFNRKNSGRWFSDRTIAAVCVKYEQFSSWNGDQMDRLNLVRVMRVADNDPVLLRCGQAYDTAAAGEADQTSGATHYVDKTIPVPAWAQGATLTLETTNFRFYKDVK